MSPASRAVLEPAPSSGSDATDPDSVERQETGTTTAESGQSSASLSALAASTSQLSHELEDMQVTHEQMQHVRSHLDPALVTGLDNATVRRFIRATGGNLALSIKRLNATLAWRRKVKPEEVVCRACAKDPQAHYMHLVGYCTKGRPIIYSCLENARNKVFEDNKDHMIQTFEWAIKTMPPGVEQWIWVCDFKGFGMADVNPKLAKLFLDISAEHYPERLGLFMIVDAPSIFGLLWRAISAFVDPKTYQKIRFLPYDALKPNSHLKGEMDLHFDSVTTEWLLREMAENRDKAKARAKQFNVASMYQQAVDGGLCGGSDFSHAHCHHGHAAAALGHGHGKEQVAHVHVHADAKELAAKAAQEPHNLLGTPALLHAFNTRPELLLPQATTTA